MTSTLKNRANALLKRSLQTVLLRQGFEKKGRTLLRAEGEIVQVVEVQYSNWNDPDEVRFTFNCGIHVPGITSRFRDSAEPGRPGLSDCCMTVRIGMLSEACLDVWWAVRSEDEADADEGSARDIEAHLQGSVLPFFRRFGSRQAVADFLARDAEGPDRFIEPRVEGLRCCYAALVSFGLGDLERCRRLLQRGVERSKSTPLRSVVARFAERFQC